MRSTPSLLPGQLWPGIVAPDRVLSMDQIELNYVLMLNGIVWSRTVFDIVLYSHLQVRAASQRHNNKDRRTQKDAGMKDAWRKTQEDFFNIILPLNLLQGSKGLFKVCMWEGAGDRT